MKLDILVIAAHPDDAELSCSGTIIKHVKAGKKVGIIDLTEGERGTRGTADIREKEAAAATKILGITTRENLHIPDGFFENNKENQLKLIEKIRKYQPEIVLANAIQDRHPDHGRGAKLASDACFLSGLVKITTSDNGKPQQAWRPKAVYHYLQDRYIRPDFIIDITEHMEQKMESIKAYKSQFYDPDSKEPPTYISSESFMESIYARASEMGKPIFVRYAEGFTAERHVGVNDLFDLR